MTINLPVLLLKNLVLLPHQEVKLELNNILSKNIIELSTRSHNNELLIVAPRNQFEESPDINDLPFIGVIAIVKSKIELPNGNYRIVLTGKRRVKIKSYSNYILDNEVLEARCMLLDFPKLNEIKELAVRRKIVDLTKDFLKIAKYVSNSFINTLNNSKDLDLLVDLVVNNVPFSMEKKLSYMVELNPYHRANALIVDLKLELQVLELDNHIEENLKMSFENNQREFILKEKLKEIQKELGDEEEKDDLTSSYFDVLNNLDISDSIKAKISKEIKKFEHTNESSPESSVIRNYLDLVLNLPWNNSSLDEDDLKVIRKYLDKSHYGLENIKERIIEYVAIKNRNKDIKSPVLCFVGPPGVGKTTLAKAVAGALKKSFYKISVGGLNDSNELIGHRKTYLGANAGKIIQGINKTGVNNPLILIDEIDKMVKDFKGDPASVLLDILDTEQNMMFIDNYIEEPFDLSKVLFILTANDIGAIPAALLDRLEIIELSSYTEFQKVDIAKNYLLPNIYKDHIVLKKDIVFNDELLLKIIKSYTKESGVRDLQRNLETIVRKIVTDWIIKDKKSIKKLTDKDLVKYLSYSKYSNNEILFDSFGVVNGMAYTPFGGLIMQIESSMYDGSGKRIITGLLGQTMNESVDVAISYIRSNKDKFMVNDYFFDKKDIHIHFLEGAIKKDGPSAGCAIVTSLISLLSSKLIDYKISMTGEINLQGDVLKIGGLREKVIGAYNSGIKKIFIPKDNVTDLEFIPKYVLDNLEIIGVNKYDEIFNNLFKEE